MTAVAVLALALTVLAQTQTTELEPTYVGGGMLVSGGIGALIGMAKGRALLGFILGAFLGCIGWIIILVIPKKLPKY